MKVDHLALKQHIGAELSTLGSDEGGWLGNYMIGHNVKAHHLHKPTDAKTIVSTYLNPSHLKVSDLHSQFMNALDRWNEKRGPDDPREIPPFYRLQGDAESFGGIRSGDETEDLLFQLARDFCIVATLRDQPDAAVGYSENAISVCAYDKELCLRLGLDMIWVRPECRGGGFGHNLMAAAGMVSARLYQEVALVLPRGWNLECTIQVEYESLGGQRLGEEYYYIMKEYRKKLIHEGFNRRRLAPIFLDGSF